MGMDLYSELEPLLTELWEVAERTYTAEVRPQHPLESQMPAPGDTIRWDHYYPPEVLIV